MEKNFETTVCPACGIIDRFGDKWSLRILVLLSQNGTMRFNEILKKTPGISEKVLASALKVLEADKLINRKMYAEMPPRVEYKLTSLGDSLMLPLEGVINWAIANSEEILTHRKDSLKRKA